MKIANIGGEVTPGDNEIALVISGGVLQGVLYGKDVPANVKVVSADFDCDEDPDDIPEGTINEDGIAVYRERPGGMLCPVQTCHWERE